MKIESLETKLYRIPPTIPWEDSAFKVNGIEFVMVELTTDTGIKGIGWTYTIGVGGTSIKALIDDYFTPIVIGTDPLCISAVWQTLWNEGKIVGPGGVMSLAIAAIDIALWDIFAKNAQAPLYKVLGGAKTRVMAYRSGVDFNMSLQDLLLQVDEYIEQGYQAIKIKVGKETPEEDVERVAAVRRRIGDNRFLFVDANQRWTASEAIKRVKMLEPCRLDWIEEPILAEDLPGHIQVRSSINTPLAIGETLYNKYQFAEFINRGGVDIVQADVARLGGITEWMRVATMALAANLPMAPHFLMEISLHIVCAVPNCYVLEDLKGGTLTELGVLNNPIKPVDGYYYPPETPGHGLDLNEAVLKRYEISSEQMKNMDLQTRKVEI